MGLESATYISGLVATNPTSGDPKSEGDNHIRLVKSTLLATFPSITGAVTATHAELNTMDGITASTAELNTMDGITATTAELNILDGVTATFAELNILDGVTATTAELNILDGVVATTAEINYLDDARSNIQDQIDAFTTLAGGNPNLLINSDFSVNQEEYSGGAITTGEYGHDMWKSISSASYTVSGYALTMVSGTLGQRNDELIGASGETVTMSVESGSVTIGATAGAAATTITPGSPYTWTLDMSGSAFVTITAATAAQGLKIERGSAATNYQKPEPRAEEERCLYYLRFIKSNGYPSLMTMGRFAGTSTQHIYFPYRMNTVHTLTASGLNWSIIGSSTSDAATMDGVMAQDFNGITARVSFGASITQDLLIRLTSSGLAFIKFDARY